MLLVTHHLKAGLTPKLRLPETFLVNTRTGAFEFELGPGSVISSLLSEVHTTSFFFVSLSLSLPLFPSLSLPLALSFSLSLPPALSPPLLCLTPSFCRPLPLSLSISLCLSLPPSLSLSHSPGRYLRFAQRVPETAELALPHPAVLLQQVVVLALPRRVLQSLHLQKEIIPVMTSINMALPYPETCKCKP